MRRRLTAEEYRELAERIDWRMAETGRAPSPAWLKEECAAVVARRRERRANHPRAAAPTSARTR